jgi:hypothetical protein
MRHDWIANEEGKEQQQIFHFDRFLLMKRAR